MCCLVCFEIWTCWVVQPPGRLSESILTQMLITQLSSPDLEPPLEASDSKEFHPAPLYVMMTDCNIMNRTMRTHRSCRADILTRTHWLPASLQALCQQQPFLPRCSDPHLSESPEAALLDRQFRLLREDMVGPSEQSFTPWASSHHHQPQQSSQEGRLNLSPSHSCSHLLPSLVQQTATAAAKPLGVCSQMRRNPTPGEVAGGSSSSLSSCSSPSSHSATCITLCVWSGCS